MDERAAAANIILINGMKIQEGRIDQDDLKPFK
jgi:hypothetical protein